MGGKHLKVDGGKTQGVQTITTAETKTSDQFLGGGKPSRQKQAGRGRPKGKNGLGKLTVGFLSREG